MGQKVVFRSALTDVWYYTQPSSQQSAVEQLGTIRFENNSVYKYVAFSGATAVAAGDVVCYVAAASDGNEQIVDGANTAFGAGVAMAAVTSGTLTTGAAAYATGWIQIKGLTAVSTTIAGAPTLGQALTTSGQTAPACGIVSAYTQQVVGQYYATKKIVADFPF